MKTTIKGYTVTFLAYGWIEDSYAPEYGCSGMRFESVVIGTKAEAFTFASESAFVTGHAEVSGNNHQGEWYFDKQENGNVIKTAM